MKVTDGLIILSFLTSFVAWSSNTLFVEEFLMYSFTNMMEGRVWTVISALFVHSGVLHLLGNMLFLFVFGRTLEDELGKTRMVGAFFLGGVVAFLLSTPFYPSDTNMVGASAAIFTLTAIAMLVKPLRFSILFLSPIGLVAIIYFLYNAFMAYQGVQDSVSYIGHLIGFGIGVPFGIAWSKKWKMNLLITFVLLAIYYVMLRVITYLLG